jgi:cyclopropane fatty-acyl-phospholipid synthase-like methyltransferase
MTKETKLRIHNITAKASLDFSSEAWVLKKRDEQRLEAAQMKLLRHLLRITKLDKGQTSVSEGETCSAEH